MRIPIKLIQTRQPCNQRYGQKVRKAAFLYATLLNIKKEEKQANVDLELEDTNSLNFTADHTDPFYIRHSPCQEYSLGLS